MPVPASQMWGFAALITESCVSGETKQSRTEHAITFERIKDSLDASLNRSSVSQAIYLKDLLCRGKTPAESTWTAWPQLFGRCSFSLWAHCSAHVLLHLQVIAWRVIIFCCVCKWAFMSVWCCFLTIIWLIDSMFSLNLVTNPVPRVPHTVCNHLLWTLCLH